jgi:NADPH-dependent 2,4-dienoyl-CoA reductase/sulfur reductase-like enzyme
MGERLVIIGGDAGGMAAATQARRTSQTLEIVAFERGADTSYSACGIPAVLGGEVFPLGALVAKTPDHFRKMNIDIRTRQLVTAVDFEARTVEVEDLVHRRHYKLGYDLLHFGTGATPARPELPGFDLSHVHGVQTLADAAGVLGFLEGRTLGDVVVVGGGYVGLEMAEAMIRRGARVTVVDASPEVMGTLDPDMGRLVARAMRMHGIAVRNDERVIGIDERAVHTDADGPGSAIPAELVILGLGVRPNAELAAAAGAELGVKGSIVVDRRQETSVEGVYAAGDCCQSIHLVSGRPVHVAVGTVANKMARVAGTNLAGGYATFAGVAGTAATRLCSTEIARTGLGEAEADHAAFDYVVGKVESTTKAGYFPGAEEMIVKLLAEKGSGRVLGAQIVGGPGSAKRIDTVVAALSARMDVDDLIGLDLAYAPFFSTVWDPLQIAARKAREAL